MSKKLLSFFAVFLFFPVFVFAQTNEVSPQPPQDQIFKAEVIKIVEEKTIKRENGSDSLQQNILLRGLEKQWKNKEIKYLGISDLDVLGANTYKIGDKVLVSEVKNIDGITDYYIVDFVRSGYLFWLAAIFAVIIILIGRKKGVKSLISLVVSFFIIIKFIVPGILQGGSPLLVGVLGALIILGIIIYLTEGWNRKSHIALVSVFFSLVVTFALSYIFTYFTRLTGLAQEEATFLLGINNSSIDFRGLLLTGILIGTVGVLDDVVVGQIESVNQIRKANPQLSNKQIYAAAYEVGNAHLAAIIILGLTVTSFPSCFSTKGLSNLVSSSKVVPSVSFSLRPVLALPTSRNLPSSMHARV